MKKKLIAMLLAAAMTISLAACGNNQGTSDQETSEGGTTSAGTEGTSAGGSDLEPYHIVMAYVGDTYDDNEKISQAINDIIETEFNCTVEILGLTWGDFAEQFTLMLSGSEQLDLLPILYGATYVNNGYVLDLRDLIDEYGTNIKKYVGEEYMYYCNVGGTIYGVPPAMKEWTSSVGLVMRADILEEAGFTKEDITSFEDVEKVYEAVSELHPDMTMIAGRQKDTPGSSFANVVDNLETGSPYAGVVLNDDEEGRVVNYFENDYFAENMQRMYEWAQKGWISKDCATISESREAQVKAGNTFSYFSPLKPDTEIQDEVNTGYDLTTVLLSDNVLQTSNVTGMGWGIGRNCKEPERVMQVLDYMYGSPEIMNLFNWGIEGEHYEVVDAENGIINYPEGVTSDNKAWGLNLGWEIMNQSIAYIWDGNAPDIWEQYKEWNTTLAKSFISNGLIFNDKDVQTEIAALSNVYDQYMDALGSGAVEPTEAIEKFNTALYKAGLQTVMDAKQEQLDEFLEKN